MPFAQGRGNHIGIVGHEDRPHRHLEARTPAEQRERVARGQHRLRHDEAQAPQILGRCDRPAAGEQGGRGDQDAPDEAEPPDDDVLALRTTVFHREVEIVVDQVDIAVVEHEVDRHGGMARLEGHDDRMQMPRTKAGRRVQAQASLDFAHVAPHLFQRRVDGGERRPARLIECPPLGRRPHQPRRPLQQPCADMPLEIAQVLGDGRLRHLEIAGRGRHGTTFDGADEGAQGDGEVHA